MNNFLTGPVRIQVRNNRNKSRDSPPCVWMQVGKVDITQTNSKMHLIDLTRICLNSRRCCKGYFTIKNNSKVIRTIVKSDETLEILNKQKVEVKT